jgi:hypothetical protein
MDNPFFFGKTVSGTSFLNRERELEELTETLARGQNIILFSPRRYGKTSLIKRVVARLQEKKVQTFYFDFYRIASLEEFFRYYSTTIINSLQSPFEKAFSLVRSLIPSLKPRLVYSEPTLPSIEVELSMDVLAKKSSLNELFDAIEKYCRIKKKKACVVFDEFQEIATIENGELLEREMRSAMQHHTLV